MSCKKWNNVCTLTTNCLCAHSNIIFVFLSLVKNSDNKHQSNTLVRWYSSSLEYIHYSLCQFKLFAWDYFASMTVAELLWTRFVRMVFTFSWQCSVVVRFTITTDTYIGVHNLLIRCWCRSREYIVNLLSNNLMTLKRWLSLYLPAYWEQRVSDQDEIKNKIISATHLKVEFRLLKPNFRRQVFKWGTVPRLSNRDLEW